MLTLSLGLSLNTVEGNPYETCSHVQNREGIDKDMRNGLHKRGVFLEDMDLLMIHSHDFVRIDASGSTTNSDSALDKSPAVTEPWKPS